MVSARKIGAAVAGLIVAILLVVLIELVTPPQDLEADSGEIVVERLEFRDAGMRFAAGAELVLVSRVGVPVDLVVVAPSNESVAFTLGPDATLPLRVAEEGTYVLRSPTYPWLAMEVEVVPSSPFERLWDDLF